MRLCDKITVAIQEVGIQAFVCDKEKEIACPERNIGKFPEKHMGHRHCLEQIPYFKDMKLYNLCDNRIRDYWKK